MAVDIRQHLLQPAHSPTVKIETCCAMHTKEVKTLHKGGSMFSEGLGVDLPLDSPAEV